VTNASELRSLDPGAQLVLAALAVVVPASLSVEELGEITEVSEAELSLDELERRGLVVREGERYALAPEEQGRLKRLLASLDTVDRVLKGVINIAEDGRLTLDDLDAVLELTRIAAATGRMAELLRLVKAAETTLSATRRVEEWGEILERRGEAEQALDCLKAPRRGRVQTSHAMVAVAAIGVSLVGGYLVGKSSAGDNDGNGKPAKQGSDQPGSEDGTGPVVPEDGTGPVVPVDDADSDGVPDSSDNCPEISNEDQADADRDGIGDACEEPVDSARSPGEGLQRAAPLPGH
jgi:Thrombospondin type 3 repeat